MLSVTLSASTSAPAGADPVGDVLLVGCGGGAKAILDDSEGRVDLPTVLINSNDSSCIQMVDEDVEGCRGDHYLASALAMDNEEAIMSYMRGYRIVILLSMLGGGTGTGMVPVIIDCAKRCGCRVVSVLGIPMEYETDRRTRAMGSLPGIIDASDRSLILDTQSFNRMYPHIKILHVMRVTARTIAFAIRNLAEVMEGPFFSTFYARIYTIAYTTDLDPSAAVRNALDHSMFETDPTNGKMVITVSSGFGAAEIESIYNTVVAMSGIIPDIVKRDDREDTKVMVFLPVRADRLF